MPTPYSELERMYAVLREQHGELIRKHAILKGISDEQHAAMLALERDRDALREQHRNAVTERNNWKVVWERTNDKLLALERDTAAAAADAPAKRDRENRALAMKIVRSLLDSGDDATTIREVSAYIMDNWVTP